MGCGIEGVCEHCGTSNEFATVDVSFALPAEHAVRYFCPECAVTVIIPAAVESRFLAQLAEQQTDQYGNESWFRSQVAATLKLFATKSRPYSLVQIPPLAIHCPEHERELRHWDNYPESRLLVCRECGLETTAFDNVTWFGSVLTQW